MKKIFTELSRPYEDWCHEFGDFYIWRLDQFPTVKNSPESEDISIKEIKDSFQEVSLGDDLGVTYPNFKKIEKELKFLSYDFTMVIFIGGQLYFLTEGKMFLQESCSDDDLVSVNHRLVTSKK